MLTDVVIANKSYTKLSIPADRATDDIAIRVMKQDCPDFLLPIKVMEIDGAREIRYELSDGIRLSYTSMKLYKRDFVAMLRNMLQPFKICNDWFLDYHCILLDTGYVMVGRKDYAIKYVYIPVEGYARTDAEIVDFFSNIILKADICDDPHYAMELLRSLKGDNSNLMTLLDFLVQGQAGMAGGAPQEERGRVEPDRRGQGAWNAGGNAGGHAGEKWPQGGGTAQWQAPPVQQMPPAQQTPPGRQTPPVQQTPPGRQAPPVQQMPPARQPEPARRPDNAAARPGQAVGEFGKQDIHGELLGSLFGEGEDTSKPRQKGGKDANPAREPKAVKDKSSQGGVFGIFKGKTKEDMTSAGNGRYAAPPVMPNAYNVQESRPNHPAPMQYDAGDVTEIFGGNEGKDDGVLRLRLVEDAGYHCPKMVEVDMRRGFATVGRLDKNGQAQSDYCFDASLSFVSRRHFRVEKDGNQWAIIDLGSANGTLVNGEPLLPNMRHPLRAGDMLMISQKNRLIYQVC